MLQSFGTLAGVMSAARTACARSTPDKLGESGQQLAQAAGGAVHASGPGVLCMLSNVDLWVTCPHYGGAPWPVSKLHNSGASLHR